MANSRDLGKRLIGLGLVGLAVGFATGGENREGAPPGWPQADVQGRRLTIRNEFRHARRHAGDVDVLALIGERRDWREVVVVGCPEITDAVLDRLAECAALQTVRIGAGRFTDAGAARLAEIQSLRVCDLSPAIDLSTPTVAALAALPNLEALSLSILRLDDETLLALAAAPRLAKLTLRNPDDGKWMYFSDEWGGCRYVPGIRKNGITRRGLEALAGMPSLTQVGIATEGVPPADAALLAAMPGLEALEWNCWPGGAFGQQQFDDDFFRALAAAPKLKTLRLWSSSSQPSLAGLRPLLERGQLEALSLSIGLPPAEHGALLALAARCTGLEELDLRFYQPAFTDADFAALAPLVHMRKLHLVAPEITEAALATMDRWERLEELVLLKTPGDALLAWAEKRPALRRLGSLGTSSTRYTAEAVKRFMAARPDCELVPFPWSLGLRPAAEPAAKPPEAAPADGPAASAPPRK